MRSCVNHYRHVGESRAPASEVELRSDVGYPDSQKEQSMRRNGSFGDSSKAKFKTAQFLGRSAGIAISLALLGWLLCSFDLPSVGRAFQTANFLYLIPAAFVFGFDLVMRAGRWGTLFDGDCRPGARSLFIAYMIGYFANNVLPARSGDLVRAYVLGEREGASKSMVLATVVVERIADLFVTILLLSFLLLLHPIPEWPARVSILLAVLGGSALLSMVILARWGAVLVRRVLKRIRFLPANLLEKIGAAGANFILGISGLRRKRNLTLFLTYTTVIWLSEIGLVWLFGLMFSLPLAFGGALFVLLSTAISMAIPSSPGSIGTFEIFTVNALKLLGITGADGLSFALLMHATTLLESSVIGVACLMESGYRTLFSRNVEPEADAIREPQEHSSSARKAG